MKAAGGAHGGRRQRLDGTWRLATDPENRGRGDGWFHGPVAGARDAPVPGIIQQVFPTYHGVAWYWLSFTTALPAGRDDRWLVRFGAVDYLADVWLNGTYLGGHEGGETPFDLDATEALRPERPNLLAVRVLNPTEEPIDGIVLAETPHRNKTVRGWRPGQSFNYGGIILPVELLVVPQLRIADAFARPDAGSGRIRLSLTVRNDGAAPASGTLWAAVGGANGGEIEDAAPLAAAFPPGDSVHETELRVARPRTWEPDDPFLYRVQVQLEAERSAHAHAVRCGFRDLRVVDGYFRLNGRRLFLRSTHTGNHVPVGQVVPVGVDFLRRDLVYAKASGFNCVRFISGMAYPEQLDACDEIGLLVYEEPLAAWLLADSPRMAERYDRAVREMVQRDRNHPSVAIWGLLNETRDGPVFRHAVGALDLVRSLDETRLVLLSSGRWDGQPAVGSLSNPGGRVWEHQWGAEAPEAPPLPPPSPNALRWEMPGYLSGAGDAHAYPTVPQTRATNAFLRALGRDTKPVFLSEYGIGSLMNVVAEARGYEQAGASPELFDAAFVRSLAERLEADWRRFGFDGVYPFPEDLLRESQRLHARQRRLGLDLIRANPRICGYNLTGMLDHAVTGEGMWTFWRHWKPGTFDAIADGWAALRWCLFADPVHGYTARPVRLEAVLASEDALGQGEYPVVFRVSGPTGVVWERRTVLRVPDDAPLALPVLAEDAVLTGPPGAYVFAANLERGGAPAGGRRSFRLSDAPLPAPRPAVALWGIGDRIEAWLRSRGVECRPFGAAAEVVLVGDPGEDAGGWEELTRRVSAGATAVVLSPGALRKGDDPLGWLPLANRGRLDRFHNWLYHKEDVAKPHPVFAGLPSGIMDWEYYDQVIPEQLFDGQDAPDDVAAASFAPAYSCPGGYAAGVVVGTYRHGAGRLVLSTLRVLENIDANPAADRLLLNLIDHAAALGRPSP